MASRRGRFALLPIVVLVVAEAPRAPARASATTPSEPVAPVDPGARSLALEQTEMVHILDTSSMKDGPYYVNDHTLVRGLDRRWHLFGIFHHEPIGEDTEFDFLHAVADEPDPAEWREGAFAPVPAPWTIALHADRAIGETHVWAPHVVRAEGRWWMIYQGGGADRDRASIRLAESDDLYRWTRVSDAPLFEDVCVARDPMLTREGGLWALYYTRCESTAHRVSGVAVRLSRDLARWSEPRMVLTLAGTPEMDNSGYTESPFAFERGGSHYLAVSPYPLAWDATLLYRSPGPFAFPPEPVARLRAHAAEFIASGSRLFFTHAGPGQYGVWLAELRGL